MSAFLPILLVASLLAPLPSHAVQGDGGLRLYGQAGIKDSYIVVFKPVDPEAVDAEVTRLAQANQAKVGFIYRHALQGFSATMTEATALGMTQDDAVAYVEQDQELAFTDEQIDAPWGIASLDSRTGFDFVYRFNTYGTGAHAYVIDSGVRPTHTDFGGRVTADAEFAGDGRGPEDCNGHGTAMAGIVGGTHHGVAKQVRVHGLRIGCTAGSTRAFMAAADWLTVNAARPAVANLSFQGLPSEAMDTAVMTLIVRGITVVASAGNSNRDSCDFSPSRVPAVITVAASHALRERAPTSSWGPCVDIFAPGDQIDTAGHASDTDTVLMGGTSPAAAHVTGAVARYLQRFPTASPALVESTLLSEATRDKVTDPHSSPNNLLYLEAQGPGNDGYGRTRGDFNGDGRDDIVTFVRGAPGDVWVALSDGVRFGTAAKWHEYFAADNEVPMVGDFNGDGFDDIVTFTRGARADVLVAVSNGSEFEAARTWHTWFAAFAETPLVGDFNGDGRDDIATLTRADSADVYVALSNGTSFVGTGVKWSETFAPFAPAVLAGDVTCDGRDDLIAFDRGTIGRVTVAVSLGTTFATPTIWRSGLVTGTQVPVVGDFTGDGCDESRSSSGAAAAGSASRPRWPRCGLWAFGPTVLWGIGFAGGVSVPGAGDFTGDGRVDVISFTRGQAADVFVAPSTGTALGGSRRWHDWFAFGLEVPMPAVLW